MLDPVRVAFKEHIRKAGTALVMNEEKVHTGSNARESHITSAVPAHPALYATSCYSLMREPCAAYCGADHNFECHAGAGQRDGRIAAGNEGGHG